MAKIGMKHPVFAPIDTEPANALPTYKQGLVVGHAISANVEIENSDTKLAADDMIVETDKTFLSGNITIGVDDISEETYLAWIGGKRRTIGEDSVIVEEGGDSPPGGFGYLCIRKKNNVRSVRAYWYFKTQFSVPSDEAATKPEGGVEFQTPEVEGVVLPVVDPASATGVSWRMWKDFADESAAVSWLDNLANIAAAAPGGGD